MQLYSSKSMMLIGALMPLNNEPTGFKYEKRRIDAGYVPYP